MRTAPVRVPPKSELEAGFNVIRSEFEITEDFHIEIEAAAAAATKKPVVFDRAGGEVVDRRDLDFVTIDPPSSIDLDQAVHITKRNTGYRVSYAISDPAVFVVPDDLVDVESRARGLTMYAPDFKAPLYPHSIGQDAASLLPGLDRPAVLWTMDLDTEGHLVDAKATRATVRSREKLSYTEAQRRINAGSGSETLMLLREVGQLRSEIEKSRGGVSLNLPSQEVEVHDDTYVLSFDQSLDVESWNAQISLLTGMAAAEIMMAGGVGLLRRLPVPDDRVIARIRQAALALSIEWPRTMSYSERIRDIVPDRPENVALLAQAVRALRGADYAAFDGELPDATIHWAIAANYSHVTAPIRRLVDRFANEIVLALCDGQRPPGWVLDALPTLPQIMNEAKRRESGFDRAIVDYVETMMLRNRVGEVFAAWVTGNRRENQSTIQIADPAVAALVNAALEAGDQVEVRLTSADTSTRRLRFETV